MRRIGLLCAILLAAFLPLKAQSYMDQVSATVTDPNGYPYANGTVVFRLVTPGGSRVYITATGADVQGTVGPSALDSTGHFSVRLVQNGDITPASTTWSATVCSQSGGTNAPIGTGSQCFTVSITASGTSQDISATLNAAAPNLIRPTPAPANGPLPQNALQAIGPSVAGAGLDISANTGRVAGLSVNLTNPGNTVTGFRGIDSRVSDAGTAAEVVGIQGLGTKTAGDGATGGHSLWGGNFISNITGGATSNVYGVYGEADAGTGTTVTGGSCALCFVNGLQGYGRASAGATLTNAWITGVTGIVGQQSGDAKGTAAIAALLEGRLSQATTGTLALFKGGNYNTGVNPDYGLDFDTTINSVALSFNNADIRLATGSTIKGTTDGEATSGAVQPGSTTVGALPAAAAGNAGEIRVVSDSTAVASEGQTCVGASTNTALAFSNGSVWKCF